MARSIAEIEALIDAERAAKPELDALDSPSKTAIWNLWKSVYAIVSFVLEGFFDLFKEDVQDIVDKGAYGTPPWWVDQMLRFQYGYNLDLVDGKPTYAVIDEDAKIIKYSAMEERRGIVTLKVLKQNKTPLSTNELTAADDYAKETKPAGIVTKVISSNPDLLKLLGTIFYDAKIGKDNVQTAVEAAIAGYLENLGFNGTFVLNKLIDAIQKVTGVVDVKFDTIEGNDFVNGYVPITRVYRARAGHMKIDPAFPLTDNLNYSASEV